MATLPKDVLFDILRRLPAKFVIRFKIVCKLWYDLIHDPDFIKLHFERSLATQSHIHFVTKTHIFHFADFDTFDNPIELDYPFKRPDYGGGATVVGSCRGLLCCLSYDQHLSLFLYNPTTQTYKMLPYVPRDPPFELLNFNFSFGFGYDSYSGDYKIVSILQKKGDDAILFKSQVMVYSLKAHSWGRIQDLPYYFNNHSGQSALVSGVILWVGENDNRVNLPIVSFDLKDETFGSIPLPDFDDKIIRRHILSVGELDACLCLLDSGVECHDVWIMKEYGRPESWMKLFSISKRTKCERLERTVSFSINRKELFLSLRHDLTVKLDLETMEITDVKVADFRRCSNTWVCVENLVMLNNVRDDSVSEARIWKKKRKNKRRRNENGLDEISPVMFLRLFDIYEVVRYRKPCIGICKNLGLLSRPT